MEKADEWLDCWMVGESRFVSVGAWRCCSVVESTVGRTVMVEVGVG